MALNDDTSAKWKQNRETDYDSFSFDDLSKSRYGQYSGKYQDFVIRGDVEEDKFKALNGAINIEIRKDYSSFDFGEKFKEFLLNDNYRKNDELINFISLCSDDIGRMIYERIQNFIGNIVNVETCQYKYLLGKYASQNIDMTYLTGIRNIPERLEYLVNIFSLPKKYYKSVFYSMSVSDSEISYEPDTIENMGSLVKATDKLNRKYFDNFYDTVAYPFFRNVFWENYDNEDEPDYKAFVDAVSNGVYDSALSGIESEFIMMNLFNNILNDKSVSNLCGHAMSVFLMNEPDYEVVESIDGSSGNKIHKDYFKIALTSNLSYKLNSDGVLPTMDMTGYISGNPNYYIGINFESPNYKDIFMMFEELICSREEFVKLLKIKLAARKLSNICSVICKLRDEIKEIRLKDSKVGTAILIEQLISEYIYKTMTQKVGLTNQKKMDAPLVNVRKNLIPSLEDEIPIEKELKDKFSEILSAEQRALGIEFEEYLEKLSTLAKTLEVEIVEYYDFTTSYLNLIPQIESIKQKKLYKVKKVECPPYLNINGVVVYADFNKKESVFLDDNVSFKDHLKQCATGSEETGYVYYYDGHLCEMDRKNNLGQIGYYEDDDVKREHFHYLYEPVEGYEFKEAVNIDKATYSPVNKWYELSSETDSNGAPVRKIVDMYDRVIDYRIYEYLMNNSGSIIMTWQNGVRISENNLRLFKQYAFGFYEYGTNLGLLRSTSKTAYVPYDESNGGEAPTVFYYGLFVDIDANLSAVETRDNVWTSFIQMTGDEISEIYKDNVITSFVWKNNSSEIIDGIGPDINYYRINQNSTYTSSEFPDKVFGCTSNHELYEDMELGRLKINSYESDLEKFYKTMNSKITFVDQFVDVIVAIDGNEPFWNELSYNPSYTDKTVDEEADIVRFYKNIGLIDDKLAGDSKYTYYDGSEELTPEWITARYNVIKKLKDIWSIHAQHTWFDGITDTERLNSGKIDKTTATDLKNMDIAYHSNIGSDMKYNVRTKLQNSITNLENWENNTVAIHPCVWNLVEKTYDNYLNLLSLSLYGDSILSKIFSSPYDWKRELKDYGQADEQGVYSVEHAPDNEYIKVHNVNYWRNYSNSFFPYRTEYEASGNSNVTDVYESRFIDFDGPLNFEALAQVIDKYWTDPESEEIDTIRNQDLSKYYIDIDQM